MASETKTSEHLARLVVDGEERGSRLDRFLMRRLGAGRRTLILRLIRKGNVRVNGKRSKPGHVLAAGDEVFLPASLRAPAAQEVESGGIPPRLRRMAEEVAVLYEDAALLAVDKPAGVVVHGGSGHGAGLIEALKQVRDLPDLRLAHRLDRDTSGVLLLAKRLSVARALADAFSTRAMEKTYFAWVSGRPRPASGRLQARLEKGVLQGGERMVVSGAGREAVTDFQVMLETDGGGVSRALLALYPRSGRTHQLRVQLQSIGHPILGDVKYAGKDDLRRWRALGGRGLALHAWRLRFDHPVTGRPLEIRAPWPARWRNLPV
ncbi:MAG: RluA family pseudouridine synthase [Mariprofundaceae bacterium]